MSIQHPTASPIRDQIVSPAVRRFRSRMLESYLVVASGVFVVLAIFARLYSYFPWDLWLTLHIQQIRLPLWDFSMKAVSIPGYPPWVYLFITAVVLVLLASKLNWEVVVFLLSLILSGGVGLLFKLLIQRARPTGDLVAIVRQLSDYSFPSGHVLTYTVAGGFLWFLSYTLFTKSWWRTLLLGLLGAFILLIGPSRVFLGAHWSSDALASYVLGSVLLVILIDFYRRRHVLLQKTGQKRVDAEGNQPEGNQHQQEVANR